MISSKDYKSISDNLGTAQFIGLDMYTNIGQMKNHLTNNALPASDPDKVELSTVIDQTYYIMLTNHIYLRDEMKQMVAALQNYIVSKVGSIDTYLQDNDIRVSESFANLSAACGYTISSENIE